MLSAVRRTLHVVASMGIALALASQGAIHAFDSAGVYNGISGALLRREVPVANDGEDDGDQGDSPLPTDYDGFDTPPTDNDGIDTPTPTDDDGVNTPYTDYDGVDTPTPIDNDGTDSDGIDTTGQLTSNDGTDSDGLDTTTPTDDSDEDSSESDDSD